LSVYYLGETAFNGAENTRELHVEKQWPLFPCSLRTGAGLSAVGRSSVLSMVAPDMRTWSQASLKALQGQMSPKSESCHPPL